MKYKVGDKVRLKSSEEVGVIVWLWENDQKIMDAYVAFFGKEFPNSKPQEKPYILRYYINSLEKF